MCGIAGVVQTDSRIENGPHLAEVFRGTLHHRGPDDAGTYCSPDGGALLTANRLAIVDLSPAGHMPMTNEDGTIWLVYNGEIYNFRTLRAELEGRGHRFRSETDSEVILHLYEEYGERCVERLRGMFAFAIWDESKRQLFAARDRLGIKPLYYTAHAGRFAFASEIRALRRAGLVSPAPDWPALGVYLQTGWVPAPRTALADVSCLLPGSWLVVRDGNVTTHRYWQPSSGGGAHCDEAEAVAGVRSLLEESVALHLISDVPLGVFLSGGLDSTTIATLAARQAAQLRTLSVVFAETSHSEAPYARETARRLGTEHIELEVGADHVVAALDRFLAAIDQPTIDGLNTYFIAEMTRGSGTIVALSGLGGDEVFGGYPSFRAMPSLASLLTKIRRIPGHASLPGVLRPLAKRSLPRRAIDSITGAQDPWTASYLAVRGVWPISTIGTILYGDALHAATTTKIDDLFDKVVPDLRGAAAFDRVSAAELSGYMANQLLRDTDLFGMAHSVEVRVPLLDHQLVEYVAGLPVHLKNGGAKHLLRQAMRETLPAEVFARPKQGFAFPWSPWLKGDLGDALLERTRDTYPVVADVLRVDQIDATWERFRRGRIHWAQPWAASMLALWLARESSA
jgi:asparagine synthase (glutamine-hydrolysing)